MKLNRIILPLMACALTWSSCDDQIMEWKTPTEVSQPPIFPLH